MSALCFISLMLGCQELSDVVLCACVGFATLQCKPIDLCNYVPRCVMCANISCFQRHISMLSLLHSIMVMVDFKGDSQRLIPHACTDKCANRSFHMVLNRVEVFCQSGV